MSICMDICIYLNTYIANRKMKNPQYKTHFAIPGTVRPRCEGVDCPEASCFSQKAVENFQPDDFMIIIYQLVCIYIYIYIYLSTAFTQMCIYDCI